MTERDALLRAVCENPDDDTPRLVYADWLQENGSKHDRARAEFIRVQCELAHRGNPFWFDRPFLGDQLLFAADRPADALIARETALLDRHGEAWVREIPVLLEPYSRFWRGFIATYAAGGTQWKRDAAKLCRATPIEEVKLRLVGGALAGLFSPRTARLSGLRLECCDPSPTAADFAALANTPHLANLKRLGINGGGDRDAVGLAKALRPPLEVLGFSGGWVTARLVEAVAAVRVPGLRWLGFASNARLGAAAGEALGGSPLLEDVESLHLGGVRDLGAAGVRALLARGCPRLRELGLAGCHVGPEGAVALAESPAMSRVTRLDLGWNDIGDRGVAALASSPNAAALSYLTLNGNEISRAGAEALVRSTHLDKLEVLELGLNPIDATGQKALKKRFGNRVSL
jgi:uncharacterized protein (TIGR02996 family)